MSVFFGHAVKEWEEEARKKNDCVEEARLLTKYKGLVFNDPDSGSTFSVWDRNMEFRRGRGNGWFVVGVSVSLFLWRWRVN